MDLIVMGRLEARRLGVVQAALAGKLTNREGAEWLKISRDQFRRLRRRVRAEGAQGIVHRNRGRRSPRRLSEEVRARAVELLTGAVRLK